MSEQEPQFDYFGSWRDIAATQSRLVQAWSKIVIDGFASYERVVDHQTRLVERTIEYQRTSPFLAFGADWFDHYGKRVRDVSVEKI